MVKNPNCSFDEALQADQIEFLPSVSASICIVHEQDIHDDSLNLKQQPFLFILPREKSRNNYSIKITYRQKTTQKTQNT